MNAETNNQKDILQKAKEAEGAQEFEQAAKIWTVTWEDNLDVEAYDRLMIAYRNLKDFKKELMTIDVGTKA